MFQKEKRKSNPRRRLLYRIIFVIGIILVSLTLIISQFEPEHDFLIYSSAESGRSNLYLYDLSTGQDVRQLTHFVDSDPDFNYIMARNAAYVAYRIQERNSVPNAPIFLLNTNTGHSRQIASGIFRDGISVRFSLEDNGRFLVYEYFNEAQDTIETRLVNLRTNQEYPLLSRTSDEYHWKGDFQWADHSLIFAFSYGRNATDPIIYRFNFDEMSGLERIDFAEDRFAYFFDSARYPAYAPDESRVIYSRTVEVNGASSLQVDWLDDSGYVPYLSGISACQEEFGECRWISFVDWHPDSEHVLLRVSYEPDDAIAREKQERYGSYGVNSVQLLLFNTTDSSYEYILPDLNYSVVSATWNSDGTQIMITRTDRRCDSYYDCQETLIFDMQTGEQIPLGGSYYRWIG